MWMLGIVVSNVAIMWLEWVYRSGTFTSFLTAIPSIIIPVLVAQAGLFYGFKLAPSLLLAGAAFSLLNIVLRSVNSTILGEPMTLYTILGIVLLLASVVVLNIHR